MYKIPKQAIVFIVIASLIFIPFWSAGLAQDQLAEQSINPDARMVGDLVLVRPLGIIGTTAGAVLFVLSWPFSALGGNSQEAFQKMVVAPAKYTFKRPLGDF